MIRRLIVALTLCVGVLVAFPEAQGRFWVLVNGALRYTGPVAINGTTTITGSVNLVGSSGNLNAASAGFIGFTSRSYSSSSADKVWLITDAAAATGMEFNVGTPTLGTCTGGSLTSGSHNFGGEVTGNTSGSCVINFGTPNYTNAPFCQAESETSLTHPRVSARSASSITVTGTVSGEAFVWHCDGRIGT